MVAILQAAVDINELGMQSTCELRKFGRQWASVRKVGHGLADHGIVFLGDGPGGERCEKVAASSWVLSTQGCVGEKKVGAQGVGLEKVGSQSEADAVTKRVLCKVADGDGYGLGVDKQRLQRGEPGVYRAGVVGADVVVEP